jgi:response regulator RpfG family c-di-GMP phosphodiesterase
MKQATFVKILAAGDAFDPARVDGYLKKNVKHFFLRKEVQGQYLLFRDRLVKGAIKVEELGFGSKQGLLTAQGTETLNFLQSVGVSESNLELAGNFVANLDSYISQAGFTEHLECAAFFEDLASVEHGVGVTMITTLLLKEMGITSARPVQTFGVAALMHDIGLKKLFPDLVFEDEKEIPPERMADYHNHPKLGAEILGKVQGVDPGLLQAIEQHHERRDRNGFPNRLGIGGINRIAEIIGISDELVHLARNYAQDSNFSYREEAQATILKRFSNQVSGAAKSLLFPQPGMFAKRA